MSRTSLPEGSASVGEVMGKRVCIVGMRLATGWMLCFWASVAIVTAAEPEPDPLLGSWLGRIHTEMEQVVVGLHFRIDQQGKLKLRLTQPVANYFDLDTGAAVERDDDRIHVQPLQLSLRLRDGRLTGQIGRAGNAIELRPATALPQPIAPPQLPIGPEPRWHARLGGQIFASPVTAGDIVYVGTTGGVLNAVDANGGAQRWAFPEGAPIYASVALTEESVYLVSDGGRLTKLDRSRGKPIWRYQMGDAEVGRILPHPSVFDWDWQAAAPVVSGDLVLAGGADGMVHAVVADSGQLRWRFSTGGAIRTAVAADGDSVYVGSHDGILYALSLGSGVERWRVDTGAPIDSVPVLHRGKLYVGNRGPGLFALDAVTGEELWRQSFWGSWVESTPVVLDDTLYIGSSDLRRVSAIDADTGKVRWRTDVYGWTWGTPLIVGDSIYAGAAGGAPYFINHVASFNRLDRSTGKLLNRRSMADSGGHQWGIAGSPILVADTVVVATIEGALLGFPLTQP